MRALPHFFTSLSIHLLITFIRSFFTLPSSITFFRTLLHIHRRHQRAHAPLPKTRDARPSLLCDDWEKREFLWLLKPFSSSHSSYRGLHLKRRSEHWSCIWGHSCWISLNGGIYLHQCTISHPSVISISMVWKARRLVLVPLPKA